MSSSNTTATVQTATRRLSSTAAALATKPMQNGQARVQADMHHPAVGETPAIHSFFEKVTGTWQYVLVDPATSEAVILDPVLDYDPASGTISTKTADRLLAFVEEQGLKVTRILETHAHADHLTSSQYLKRQLGGSVPIGIGARITQVQQRFAPVYGFDDNALLDDAFDVYFKDDQSFALGSLQCTVVHLPGHTPDHVGYVFGKAIFTGDSIFNPDVGSARADFPGGDAQDLYKSMQRLMTFPEDALLFVGHDYPPAPGRAPTTAATVAEHRKLWAAKDEDSFVSWRRQRDAGLGAPRLLHPSLQVNIRAGRLPPKDAQGRMYFKTPLAGVTDL
ncbi:Metallo-hydrolase/oxidoreductase [Phanerochaete sordida]|uniref:Metallo-hydrolase/oxidoreductase n=1 Tax=Phanerochaete sordida TaxID=48140 RepID=A0A9P3GHA2_9APHY|nr:Metallo-hydrolase/oxidoreductase [Phanerochaete sordida]